MPALLQVASTVLFIATVVYSHRIGAPIWKSSVLAIWYHAAEDLRGESEIAVERLSDMGKLAGATAVQLKRSDEDLGHAFKRVNVKKARPEEQDGDRNLIA